MGNVSKPTTNKQKEFLKNFQMVRSESDFYFGDIIIYSRNIGKSLFILRESTENSEESYRALIKKFSSYSTLKHSHLLEIIGSLNLIPDFLPREEKGFCGNFFKVSVVFEYPELTFLEEICEKEMNRSPFTESELFDICHDIVSALKYLNQYGFDHCNISPTTIYKSSNGVYKLPLPEIMFITNIYDQVSYAPYASPFIYLSPLQLQSIKEYKLKATHNPIKSDIFSLGVTLLHAATLQSCEFVYNYNELLIDIKTLTARISSVKISYSENLYELLKEMVEINEEKRIDFHGILKKCLNIQSSGVLFSHREGKDSNESSFYHSLKINKEEPPNHLHENYSNNSERMTFARDINENYISIKAIPFEGIIDRKYRNQIYDNISSPQFNRSKAPIKSLLSRVDAAISSIREITPGKSLREDELIQKSGHIRVNSQGNWNPELKFNGRNNSKFTNSFSEHPYHYNGAQLNNYGRIRETISSSDDDNNKETSGVIKQIFDYQNQHYDNSNQSHMNPTFGGLVKTFDNQNENEERFDKNSNFELIPIENKLSKLFSFNNKDISTNNFRNPQLEGEEHVIEVFNNGAKYEGVKLNGERNGFGKFRFSDGGCYIGTWKDNKMHGKGILYYPNGQPAYDGTWVFDNFEGIGCLYNDHVIEFTGLFDYNNLNLLEDKWIKYEGSFLKDDKNGEGTIFLSNGEKFQGTFSQDEANGEGVFIRLDKTLIKGHWRHNIYSY